MGGARWQLDPCRGDHRRMCRFGVIGSNPASGDSPHWFFGDGMVHGIRFENGAAIAYRSRYVNTPLYSAGVGFGQGAPGGALVWG